MRSFFTQKFDGKIIFTWYFGAFHDIPDQGNTIFGAVKMKKKVTNDEKDM